MPTIDSIADPLLIILIVSIVNMVHVEKLVSPVVTTSPLVWSDLLKSILNKQLAPPCCSPVLHHCVAMVQHASSPLATIPLVTAIDSLVEATIPSSITIVKSTIVTTPWDLPIVEV